VKSARRVYLDALTGAAGSCLANPLRSGLGVLAIAAAVATIAIVVTGLDGFARFTRQVSARAFGSEAFVLLQAKTGEASRRELADKLARNPVVTRSDVRFLERHASGDVIYAPVAQQRADVTAGGRRFDNAAVTGTAAALFDIRDLGLARGRFLRRDEETRAAQVAVIGADVADQLFPSQDPLGRRVRLAGRGFDVIGVQARQGSAGGASLDRNVYVPLQAFERAFGGAGSLQVFTRAAAPVETETAEGRARVTLRARRQLGPGKADTFDVLTPEAARGFVERLSERVGAAAAPISIMALLAAIVVVTNTTLVSVTQRIHEIGVRRAIGASREQVRREVLAESTLVSLAGGLGGLATAAALLALVPASADFPLHVRGSGIAHGLVASALAGALSGLYPALRASRVDVATALRLE